MNKAINLVGVAFSNFLGFGFLMFIGLYDHTMSSTSLIIGVVVAIAVIILFLVMGELDDEDGVGAGVVGSLSAAIMIILAIGLAPITADRGYCKVTSTEIVEKTRLKSINPNTAKGTYETKKDLDTSYAVDEDCMENPWSFQSTFAMVFRSIIIGVPTLLILIFVAIERDDIKKLIKELISSTGQKKKRKPVKKKK